MLYDIFMSTDKCAPINKKKSLLELMIIIGVGLLIFLVRFLPWSIEQPIPYYDPMAKNQRLVRMADEYDYG